MSIAEPLFVVGCIRSGTTIIHNMLLKYLPRAVDIDDADFECRTFWQRRGFNIGSPKTGTCCEAYGQEDLTEAQAREIREWFARRAGSNRHIVNKNPHLSNKIGLVHALFPKARIIHIIRDDLAVVASTKLRFAAAHAGQNFREESFLHYWPDEGELSCWWCVRDERAREGRVPLRTRLRRSLARLRLPAQRHLPFDEFRRRYPDASRYYPGDGFARIPESWLTINAGIMRQVDRLGIEGLYLPVNYGALVDRTKDTLKQIADFCEIDVRAPGAVPDNLDRSRQDRWRKDLTAEERGVVAQTSEEFHVEANMIRERLPGQLVAGREVAIT